MKHAILIFITAVLSANANANSLNKAELLEDFSYQHISIKFGDKMYCIEATETEFIPVNDIQGCQKIADVTIMNKGAVCIEDEEIVCKKIKRKSSGVFWGSKNKIEFSQSLSELKNKFSTNSDGSNTGKKYYKKAKKYYKKKDYYNAYKWAKKSAELGYKGGYFGVGLAYELGKGVEDKNKKEAIVWYRKAAEKGHVRAQVKVASLVRFDDPDEAVKWLKEAADNGNTSAMNNIGYMWAKGQMSTFGNNKKAYEWYMKSAKLGNKSGQYNICRALYYGKGVTQNKKEARKWCQRAVDQGYKKALNLLEKTKS